MDQRDNISAACARDRVCQHADEANGLSRAANRRYVRTEPSIWVPSVNLPSGKFLLVMGYLTASFVTFFFFFYIFLTANNNSRNNNDGIYSCAEPFVYLLRRNTFSDLLCIFFPPLPIFKLSCLYYWVVGVLYIFKIQVAY